jgi:YgiT-type zinc finger domain-containing protein
MKCFFCKGTVEDRASTFMADLETCIVIIKNVPSQVCGQCGEISYSNDVARQLERIVDSLKKTALNTIAPTEITVVNYTGKVA